MFQLDWLRWLAVPTYLKIWRHIWMLPKLLAVKDSNMVLFDYKGLFFFQFYWIKTPYVLTKTYWDLSIRIFHA